VLHDTSALRAFGVRRMVTARATSPFGKALDLDDLGAVVGTGSARQDGPAIRAVSSSTRTPSRAPRFSVLACDMSLPFADVIARYPFMTGGRFMAILKFYRIRKMRSSTQWHDRPPFFRKLG
jgi:hypothetical protein